MFFSVFGGQSSHTENPVNLFEPFDCVMRHLGIQIDERILISALDLTGKILDIQTVLSEESRDL